MSTPSSVMLFWSRRAPTTSPVGVTPGCRLNSSTTLRVISGSCRTCCSLKAFPIEASTVLIVEMTASTFTVSVSAPSSSRMSTDAGVFTCSVTFVVDVRNPASSAVTV